MTEHIFREVHYGYTDGTALGRTLEKQEEIVRCCDCEHYDSERYGCWWFAHAERQSDYSWADEPSDVKPDGFCAWAERRQP